MVRVFDFVEHEFKVWHMVFDFVRIILGQSWKFYLLNII